MNMPQEITIKRRRSAIDKRICYHVDMIECDGTNYSVVCYDELPKVLRTLAVEYEEV